MKPCYLPYRKVTMSNTESASSNIPPYSFTISSHCCSQPPLFWIINHWFTILYRMTHLTFQNQYCNSDMSEFKSQLKNTCSQGCIYNIPSSVDQKVLSGMYCIIQVIYKDNSMDDHGLLGNSIPCVLSHSMINNK